MWKRKELKIKAKEVVKKNYWTAVVVCFLIALFTGEFGTSIVGLWQSNDSMDPNYVANTEKSIYNAIYGNRMEIDKVYERITDLNKENIDYTLSEAQKGALQAVEANLNSATKSQKYIFKIYDAVKSFNLNETQLGIFLLIGAVIAFLFTIFIADPLIVGGKRYFLKAREDNNTKINVILDVFKNKNLLNVSKIMFLRNLFNALWDLTIIGGVIKTYEYRMIPYILAENPKTPRKEAFIISKTLMKGNKWKTFVLDMSFFGWNFLSILTMGLLSIFYVNPYNSATIAELYTTLKNKENEN